MSVKIHANYCFKKIIRLADLIVLRIRNQFYVHCILF